MLRWISFFLIIIFIVLIIALVGAGAIVLEVARFLFYLFIGIFVLLFLVGLNSKGPPP